MELFLVQHGEAKPEPEDPERPLTEVGAQGAERVAAWAARAGVKVDEIRHSGKRRAEETAIIMARHLCPAGVVRPVTGLAPKDDVRPVGEEVARAEKRLMLVGHLPFLSRLASLLLAGDPERTLIRFRNAGIVCLVREEGSWLVGWMTTPGQLGG
jgi:phosphohistidine phosphatase